MKSLSALRIGVLGGVLVGVWSCTAIVGVGDYTSGGGDSGSGDSSAVDSGETSPDTGSVDSGTTRDAAKDTGSGMDSGGCATPLCNGACCSAGEICITTNGIEACAQSCASNYALTATCAGSTPCCHTLTNDTDGGSTWNGDAVCLSTPSQNEGVCLCTTSAECAGESCAPWPTSSPLGGAYSLCEPNDGAFLHGCNENCGTCNDCVIDCHGNHYCAASFGTGCSGGTCPAPNWCIATPSGCDNSVESCSSDCVLCACE